MISASEAPVCSELLTLVKLVSSRQYWVMLLVSNFGNDPRSGISVSRHTLPYRRVEVSCWPR